MKAIKEFIRLNKKMFYVMCSVVGLFVLLLLILFITKLVNGSKISYSKLQDKVIVAAQKYYSDNKDNLPKNEEDKISVSIDVLVNEGYIKSLNKLVGSSCSGNVTVRKNGDDYMYYPFVDCGSDYKTKTLGSIITDESNVVTSGDGLYKTDNGYVFRGEYVNNYVSFAGGTWRIINIDNDGNIRMIKQDKEPDYHVWDDRYNVDVDEYYGINNFEKSRIKEELDYIYSELASSYKKHLLLQKVCTDSKKRDDSMMKFSCNKYTSAYIGLIYPSDYYIASLDSNCNNVESQSCVNYNYIYNVVQNAWTSISDSEKSYQSYFIDAYVDPANDATRKNLYLVISISNLEPYMSGTGTEENPYIVK